jgi:hypothetical protein
MIHFTIVTRPSILLKTSKNGCHSLHASHPPNERHTFITDEQKLAPRPAPR